eukprot:16937-Heterococcus_DN1.PRE.1
MNLANLVTTAALADCALRKSCVVKTGQNLARAPHLAVRQQPGDSRSWLALLLALVLLQDRLQHHSVSSSPAAAATELEAMADYHQQSPSHLWQQLGALRICASRACCACNSCAAVDTMQNSPRIMITVHTANSMFVYYIFFIE